MCIFVPAKKPNGTASLPSVAAESRFRGVAQPGSAPALGAGGPRFESWCPDNKTTQLSGYQVVGFLVLGGWDRILAFQIQG